MLTCDATRGAWQCNQLHVQLSSLANLHVKYNDEKSYDYTNPNLQPGKNPLSHSFIGDRNRLDSLGNGVLILLSSAYV